MLQIKDLPKHIYEADCQFTEDMDRIFTNLILMDYDWMHYRIQAEIPMDEQIINVEFVYTGFTISDMTVEIGDERVQFRFSTDIFNKYFVKYLQTQIDTTQGTYAFYGGDIIIDFWNEVMDNYTEKITDHVEKIIFPKQVET